MPTADYMSFEGTLTRHAEMRQVPCDKLGTMRPAVCLHLLTSTKRPVHAQYFFADALAAQAYAKGLKKGAVVTVHIATAALHMSGVADFVEVQTPPVNAQEPELQF